MKTNVVPRLVKQGNWAAAVGVVKSYPVAFGDNTSFILQCEFMESSGKKWRTSERLNVVLEGNVGRNAIYPGLSLSVDGRLVIRENSGSWLSAMGAVAELSAQTGSLKIIDNGNLLSRFIEIMRNRLEDGIDKVFDPRVIPMVKGFSLGSMNELDRTTRDNLSDSGLSHIIAVSGMHISATAAIIIALAGIMGLGRKTGFSAAILFGFAIIAVSGFRPSAVRSAIMVFTSLAGVLIGRRHDAYNGFCVAGIIILLLNPKALFDLGFQYSFAAVIGIFAVTHGMGEMGVLRSLVAVWAGAQIGILPVMLLHAQQVPVTSLPANMIAVPLFGPALLLSLCAAGVSYLSVAAGRIIALPPTIYTNSVLWISNRFSALPKARIAWLIPGIAFVVFCASLLMIAYGIRHKEKLYKSLAVMVCALLILNLPGWFAFRFNSSNRLVILNVGQGDSILIQDKTGISVLVDGGPDGEIIVEKLRKYGIRKLDMVVLTHPHEDHVSGLLAVVRKIPVGRVLETCIDDIELSTYREFENELNRRGIKSTRARAGQSISLSAHCRLSILHPGKRYQGKTDDLNNSSIVIMCKMDKARALLMGDAEMEAQDRLIRENADLDCDVLKIPHQGSADSASREFIDECRPEFAVISVGADNEYGHPSKECLDLLKREGVKTFRTDRMGDIVISVEKKKVSIRADKGEI